MRYRSTWLTAAIAASSLGAARAQDTAPARTDDTLPLEQPVTSPGTESVVSATRTESELSSIPGSVSVVTREQVQEQATIDRELKTTDPAAIERIEVIRGATSIYGFGASGGLVTIITRRPAESLGWQATHQISGSRDNFDFLTATVSYNHADVPGSEMNRVMDDGFDNLLRGKSGEGWRKPAPPSPRVMQLGSG